MGKLKIPETHPRAESLRVRERLIDAFEKKVVAAAGLIAHGRGECFDYIIGERTQHFALKAEEAAVAALILAGHPVISVNGNAAALSGKHLVELAGSVNAKIEVNLFYRSAEREKAVARLLRGLGAKDLLGIGADASATIQGMDSKRGRVDPRGLLTADTVLVSLEDGDRTSALMRMGKRVVAVDLNPFSRTALWASITIVDNITRAVPSMVKMAATLKAKTREQLREILDRYDNRETLREAVNFINSRLTSFTQAEILSPELLEAAVRIHGR